ncbi:hypothetical protein [Mogibacterium sp.]
MPYCSKKNVKLWSEMQEIWKSEILNNNLINWDLLYKYDFRQEIGLSSVRCEDTPLHQIIWGEQISAYLNAKNNRGYFYKLNKHYITIGCKENNTEFYRFNFDIMNNCNSLKRNGEGHKYYIGNFTPIPRNKISKYNLHFIHRGYGKNWQFTLKYLKNHWRELEIGFSFDDYANMTLQNFYYNDDKFIDFFYDEKLIEAIEKRGKEIQEICKKLFINNRSM